MKNFKYLFAFLAIGFVSCETDTGDESFMENRTVIAGYTDSSVNLLASAAGPNTYNLTVAVSQIAKSDMAFDIVIDDNSTANRDSSGLSYRNSSTHRQAFAGRFEQHWQKHTASSETENPGNT